MTPQELTLIELRQRAEKKDEAIAFAEWKDKNAWAVNDHWGIHNNGGGISVVSLSELYDKYKEDNP